MSEKNTEKKSFKERRYEKRKADYEARQKLSFDEYETRRRQAVRNRFKIACAFAGATTAAFAAGKAAAASKYNEALTVDKVPTQELEFQPADPTPSVEFNPGAQWTESEATTTGNE